MKRSGILSSLHQLQKGNVGLGILDWIIQDPTIERTSTTVVMTLTKRGVLGQKIDTRASKMATTPRGRKTVAIAANAELIHMMMYKGYKKKSGIGNRAGGFGTIQRRHQNKP